MAGQCIDENKHAFARLNHLLACEDAMDGVKPGPKGSVARLVAAARKVWHTTNRNHDDWIELQAALAPFVDGG